MASGINLEKKRTRVPEGKKRAHRFYYAYLLECADHSYYAGYTTDVEKRVQAHNEGRGARYTRSHRPVHLAASWAYPTKSEALRMEAAIKNLSHQKKAELLAVRPSAEELWNQLLSE